MSSHIKHTKKLSRDNKFIEYIYFSPYGFPAGLLCCLGRDQLAKTTNNVKIQDPPN